ncbi:ATP-binding protein [Nakamurella antarctica]|uniref:ATP-binding protein n=1 Tax=Nakamurella antarctica TaxID=1902245 RepID=UPI0013DE0172|nr:ATP-binding protein [Nakamurella antarctica]
MESAASLSLLSIDESRVVVGATFNLRGAIAAAVQVRNDMHWQHQEIAEAAVGVLAHEPADAAAWQLPSGWAERFGLCAIDIALLTTALAAELHPTVHLLTGLLAGDAGPGRPTVALALELAGISPTAPAARARLHSLAPLLRLRLIALDGADALHSRRIRVPCRVASQAIGDDLPPASLLPLLVSLPSIPLGSVELVASALEEGQPLIWIQGPAGSAGASMALAACQMLDAAALVADLHRHPSLLERPEMGENGMLQRSTSQAESLQQSLAELVMESCLTGSILIIHGLELLSGSLSMLAATPLPVIAVSAERWNPLWGIDLPVCVHAPTLSVADRENLWSPVLDGGGISRDISALRLSPENIGIVSRHARLMRRLAARAHPLEVEIRTSARQLGRGPSNQFADAGSVRMSDLVLPERIAAEVQRLLDWARYRDEVLAQGPLQGKGGKGGGICALFSGGPGTGKTLAAHAVADTLGMDLIQVDLSGVVSKYIGETEKNLEKVFTEAESLNAVLFFDEADSLFGTRSSVKDSNDRYANQEVAYLLQRMEQFDGITVLATNLRGNLDPAFARRLHFIIAFPDPDVPTRQRLWQHHIESIGRLDQKDPITVDSLAGALEIAGGDIRNIVLSAAYAATAEGEGVGMRHLVAAVLREYTKLGRRPPGGPWQSGSVHHSKA